MEQEYTRSAPAEQDAWLAGLSEIEQRMGGRFARSEPRRQALTYLQGLLNSVERKNSWQLAKAAGEANPYGIQHLLGRAEWDADGVQTDLCAYICDHLRHPHGILIIDEAGFPKRGCRSVGVENQYNQNTGLRQNCQVGLFLVYATPGGYAFLDRALYLPPGWANHSEQRRVAGVPENKEFASKPDLAARMIGQALDRGVPASWVVGEQTYGDDRTLRSALEGQKQAYLLAVSHGETVWIRVRQYRISDLLQRLPESAWQRLTDEPMLRDTECEVSDWMRLTLNPPLTEGWGRWLLIRRSVLDSLELNAYLVYAPNQITLKQLVTVVSTYKSVAGQLAQARAAAGMGCYEVRSWTGWYRHITLAMWGHALRTVVQMQAAALET